MRRLPIFVYGTLLPEQPNHHLLADEIVKQQSAILPTSRLLDMGDAPMLLEGGYQAVSGMLVYIDEADYEETLNRLDASEGFQPDNRAESLFLRKKRQVQLDDGTLSVAWVYFGRSRDAKGKKSFGGDWAVYSAENTQNARPHISA